jgi:hypothetical protein
MSWFDPDGELQPKKIGISVLEKGEWKKLDSSEYKAKFMK